LHAYRIGVRVLWCLVRDKAGRADLGRLATLTLEYLDQVSTATEQAYGEERERWVDSHDDAVSLFVARLLGGEFGTDGSAEAEAMRLGYDLSKPQVAVLVAPSPDPSRRESVDDIELAMARRALRRWLGGHLSAQTRSGVFFSIQSRSATDVGTLFRSALRSAGSANYPLVAAVGTSQPGASGLLTSYDEARRALALGTILNPVEEVYRYDQLSFFDLFQRGERIGAFVEEVLGALLAHDSQGHTHLVSTLYAFFISGMSRKAAARRLGIHPNTLDYRLRKAKEVSGVTIRGEEFGFRFQLALRLLPLVVRGDEPRH